MKSWGRVPQSFFYLRDELDSIGFYLRSEWAYFLYKFFRSGDVKLAGAVLRGTFICDSFVKLILLKTLTLKKRTPYPI